MNAMSRISRRLFLAFSVLTVGLAQAQLSIEITGAGANRIPVAIADFSGDATAARIVSGTVRADLEHEAERLRDMDFAGFHSIAPWRSPEENAAQLVRFLDVPPEQALAVARTDYLFSD